MGLRGNMIKVLGTHGSGKTTKLIKLAAENNYILVEPNHRMASFAEEQARKLGKHINVITIDDFISRQFCFRDEQFEYLFDELDLCLSMLKIRGYSNPKEPDAIENVAKYEYNFKPIVVKAIEFSGINFKEIREFVGDALIYTNDGIELHTVFGNIAVAQGDYIIKTPEGMIYTCSPDYFVRTFKKSE